MYQEQTFSDDLSYSNATSIIKTQKGDILNPLLFPTLENLEFPNQYIFNQDFIIEVLLPFPQKVSFKKGQVILAKKLSKNDSFFYTTIEGGMPTIGKGIIGGGKSTLNIQIPESILEKTKTYIPRQKPMVAYIEPQKPTAPIVSQTPSVPQTPAIPSTPSVPDTPVLPQTPSVPETPTSNKNTKLILLGLGGLALVYFLFLRKKQ